MRAAALSALLPGLLLAHVGADGPPAPHLVASAEGGAMQKVLLRSGAKCLDGSAAGYYIDSRASDRWVVWLEGGGLCQTEADCALRSESDLGSSNGWAASFPAYRDLLKNDPAQNPDFADFNHVYVPYCSGDLWIGRTTEALNPFDAGAASNSSSSWTGHFEGHLIVDQVLTDITANGTRPVDEMLLTGCSAGGIGTFANCDYVAGRFPQASKVRCRPEAGWFGLAIDTYAQFTDKIVPPDPHHFISANWTDRIKPWIEDDAGFQECVANGNPDPTCPSAERCCTLVPYYYPYIKTPTFVSENTADSYQVFAQGLCPHAETPQVEAYVGYLHDILAGSMTQQVVHGNKVAQDGIFAPACLAHCMTWTGNKAATVRGKSLGQAFGDWYMGRDKPGASMYFDNSTDTQQLLACTDQEI